MSLIKNSATTNNKNATPSAISDQPVHLLIPVFQIAFLRRSAAAVNPTMAHSAHPSSSATKVRL